MDENKTINNAMSTDNGIICYSNLIPFIGVRTYHDENGKIQKEQTFGGLVVDALAENAFTEVGKKESRIMNGIILALGLLLIIIYNNGIFAVMLCYMYAKKTTDTYIMFYKMIREFKSKNGSKRKLAKYHGAEHKVVTAYNKKHDIPTLEEVKKTSRFAKECSSMRLFNKVAEDTCFILVCIICNFTSVKIQKMVNEEKTEFLLIFTVTMIAFIVVLVIVLTFLFNIIKDKGILKFMQVFATAEPTEKELNLAVEAVKNFEKLEEDILKGNLEGFEIEFASDDFKEIIFGKEDEEEG